jgi:hypothetical protein
MWSPFFICGCPRSGTSALRNVFNNDVRFVIGMERYYYRAAKSFSLENKLFEKDRFFDLQEGDTFWPELSMYDGLQNRFNEAIYRGDKIPKLYSHLNELFVALPNTKVLFIIRDIFDVAASYNARANNENDKNWSREQNYKVAVDDWNASLVALYQSLYEKKNAIIPVLYENFFGNESSIGVIYEKLGLSITAEIQEGFSTFANKYKQLNSGNEKPKLANHEEAYITENANFKLYNWLKERES